MEKSNRKEHLQTKDFLKSTLCPANGQSSNPLFATVELAQPNKKMISQDKSHTCDKTSPKQKSSKILGQDSITKEKVYGPYWTDSCKEIASRLSWLTEIGSADLVSNSLTTWSPKTVEKSWFSTKLTQAHNKNLFKTYCQSYMSSLAESTASEDTVTRSKKIRILPNPQQKQKLKQWLGTYRFVYNHTLGYLQNQPKYDVNHIVPIKNTTPRWLDIKTSIIGNLPDWAETIPYQIKSLAIKEAINNLKQQKKQAVLKHRKFKMRFKSRKAPQQSCYIPKSAIKQKGVYPRHLGKLKYAEDLPPNLKDSRLIAAYDKFYLTIPYQKPRILTENQGRVVAIDPGIRKFITFVSHNTAGHLGNHDIGRIYRLCHYLDRLVSKRTRAKFLNKSNLKRAANRIREKIKNLIDELHHKVAHFLVKNYDLIFLPTFETQQMVSKIKRKIRSKTARAMMTFSHHKFKQRLKAKAFEHGKVVVGCDEAYTSKTNNFTGELNHKLGGKEYITYGYKRIDRDINGALGILLKALGDTPLEGSQIPLCTSNIVSKC